MSVEIATDSPLAAALTTAIQPKLEEVGWTTSGDTGLAELIILMLANSKNEQEIGPEIASVIGVGPEDAALGDFSRWLFQQIEGLSAQMNGGQAATAGFTEGDGAAGEMDTDMNTPEGSELNAPTGPRSMRNGNARGGREKRMIGQMSRAMDRSGDNVLHRVRGQGGERINTHGRGPPAGPRGGGGRMPRHNMNRAANIQNGLAMGAAGPQGAAWMMQGQQPSQMDLVAMMEQQNQFMAQLSQQLMTGGGGGFGQRRGGKSLFDRAQNPHNRNNFRKGHHNSGGNQTETTGEGDDMDMSGTKREPANPEDSVCKFNLNCTNKECKFAHQSPAAPRGVTVDVNDVCTFGAACKNRKCVGRHPSPAQKTAHQGEQDCKFYPNCHNPNCPFRHPAMPLCRNGANCTTTDCKFTHVKTKCKFNPCLNKNCAFAHEEGQQGGFKDKVWTAEGGQEGDHVSERKFVDGQANEELIKPENEQMEQVDIA